MQVFRGIPERAQHSSVLTIGNFDGVHLGHRALLQLLIDKARSLALPASVLTFEPHPREYFAPDQAPPRLASLREKLLLLESCGVDRVFVGRFNARFAAHTAEQFIEDILARGLGVRHLMVGDDFRFGKQRKGDFAMLEQAGKLLRFGVEAMPTLELNGERVSSSAVRAALHEGRLSDAAALLGRPYSIAGRVVRGDRIGRTIGFPTANIQLKHRRTPLSGVFAVSVEGLEGSRLHYGVANVGVRPSVSAAGKPTLEVNLFDWGDDCYGAHLRINFHHRLRAEMKFDGLAALKTQIARDAALARTWLTANLN